MFRAFAKRFMSISIITIYVAGLLVSLITTLIPKTVSAKMPDLTFPCGASIKEKTDYSYDKYIVFSKDCLQIKIIDRSRIDVLWPKDGDKRIYKGSTNETKVQNIGGYYDRAKFSNDKYSDARGSHSRLKVTSTAISQHAQGNDPLADELYKRWDTLSEDEIKLFFWKLYISLDNGGEDINGGDFCGNDTTDDYLLFKIDGNKAQWDCADSNSPEAILEIEKNLVGNLSNFNITHTASADLQELTSVYEGNDVSKDSFVYCGDNDKKYALESCNDPRDGYTISEQSSFFEGTDSVTVTAKSSTGKKDINMRIAQSKSQLAIDEQQSGRGSTVSADALECDAGGITGIIHNPLNWFMCPFVNGLKVAIEKYDEQITTLLNLPTDNLFNENKDTGEAFHTAWSRFRNTAMVLLVLIALIMIISQAIAIGPFDAYTIKHIMPRLLISVIFISLSWDLMKYAVDLSNILGLGVRGLIYSPFGAHNFDNAVNITAGGAFIFTAAGGSALVLLGTVGILLLALTGIIGVITALFILMAREMLIMFLVVVAPIAIMCSILPNTQKAWKMWTNYFSRALLLFVLFSAVVATGRAFALISQSLHHGTLGTLFAFVAFFGPYFMLPTIFKMSGGAIAAISGAAYGATQGIRGSLSKARANRVRMNSQRVLSGDRYQGRNFLARGFNRAGLGLATGARGHFGVGERGRQATALNAQANADEALKNNPRLQKLAFNDDGNAVMALSGGTQRGAEDAARDLFTDENGNYDEVRAHRAVEAAAAVGFNRSNARAAMTTLAQNKARSVAVGARGRAQMQAGFNRLAGNNAQEANDMRDSFAFFASGAGRGDIGAVDWNEQHASLAGFERAGLYQTSNGHQNGVIGARDDALALAASGNHDDQQRAAVHLEELRAMIPNTSGPVRDEVNESIRLLEADPALQAHLATQTGGVEHEVFDRERGDTTHARYDPGYVAGWNAQDMARGYRDRPQTYADIARHEARSYERPDPYNLQQQQQSDIRVKENINSLGTTNGFNIYSFNYIWDLSTTYVGVMAQDLLETHLEAVLMGDNGYYVVDYAMLGLRMNTLEEWLIDPHSILLANEQTKEYIPHS